MSKSWRKTNPTYRSWTRMRNRCLNPNAADFSHYGGRGISICVEWEDFLVFLRDMGERPSGTSLDRIDVNGNYEPGNCRWATAKQQANNRSNTPFVLYMGKEWSLSDLAHECGLPYGLLSQRFRAGKRTSIELLKPARFKAPNGAGRTKK